jgi:hypothetical protein
MWSPLWSFHATHLPTVCLRQPRICQEFACDGQVFANCLPVTAKAFAYGLFAYDGQGQRLACDGQSFANDLPLMAKHLPTVHLPTVCL